jgi:hypothetical protein
MNRQSPDYATEVPTTFGASYVLFIFMGGGGGGWGGGGGGGGGGGDSGNRFFTRSQRSGL